MFDIGWSEILIIAVVAVVVIGPKDLPRALRAFGKTMGMVRRTANDFRRQFDDALREAEKEADLADLRKTVASIRQDVESVARGSVPVEAKPEAAVPAADAVHEAEPVKTGAEGVDQAAASAHPGQPEAPAEPASAPTPVPLAQPDSAAPEPEITIAASAPSTPAASTAPAVSSSEQTPEHAAVPAPENAKEPVASSKAESNAA
ncbi:sec-independent protein translocase protein TatB [Faunimonas pinastri]|uniref:Sec-independent protein translocase protein TatB n=1 Tax=Faunimonas pinastri TaxID=1855383 RepID=A0A1H9CTZ8_9HYPH|nr:Sec-independent protein translocase protein TatB [Faunimonas pinastri]SEQ04073.1 sec-independent protein translocase protein TatB [Faunimonas pinastri]